MKPTTMATIASLMAFCLIAFLVYNYTQDKDFNGPATRVEFSDCDHRWLPWDEPKLTLQEHTAPANEQMRRCKYCGLAQKRKVTYKD